MKLSGPVWEAWLDHMLTLHLLGPGCGSAEFEGADWREQVKWRMEAGLRPHLVGRFEAWGKAGGGS